MNEPLSTEQTPHLYELYHATDIMAMLQPDPRDWMYHRELRYRHVANVEAERSRIFDITNRYEGHEWTEQPEVTWVVSPATRSTSVGDVIYSPETSQAWLVGHCGYQEIERDDDD
jgi:hypothetical protein